jgi:hypothetical protein
MPEETPAARTMAAALAAHGFRVDLSCRETPPSLHPRDEQDGDRDGGACWLAVKYTEFRVAAPAQACAARATYTADLAQAA